MLQIVKCNFTFCRPRAEDRRRRFLAHGLKPRAQVLNPLTEPVVLDDKLSILDIRARDQRDRQFNVEMQMVASASSPGRFLYYATKLHSSQLQSGDEYDQLAPVVSICFLDGFIFPQSDRYHLKFRLFDPQAQLTYSDEWTNCSDWSNSFAAN